jgi:cytochrome c oxidase assembly factor CtaG
VQPLSFIVLATLSAIAIRGDVLEAAEFQLATHMIFEHALFLIIGALSVLIGEIILRFLTSPDISSRQISKKSILRSQTAGLWRSMMRNVFAKVHGLLWLAIAVGLMAFWHLPEVFDLATRSESVHVLQHTSFVMVGAAGFIATRMFGDSFRILLLFTIVSMMSFAGLLFSVLDKSVYSAYPTLDHNRAGDYMIIVSMLLLIVGLPGFLIKKTLSYVRSVNSEPL